MKRISMILLLCLLLPLCLTACGREEPVTEEEILPIAKSLIERSIVVNTALIGDGAPRGDEAFGEYLYVDRAWEDLHSVRSVEDLLSLTASVYTTQIYGILYSEAITKDGQEPPDYQNRAVTDTNPLGGLLIHKDREGWYKDTEHEYRYDTMKMTASTANTATVTMKVVITPEGYKPQERELTLNLLRTADGWRCDKLTYVAYDYSIVNE